MIEDAMALLGLGANHMRRWERVMACPQCQHVYGTLEDYRRRPPALDTRSGPLGTRCPFDHHYAWGRITSAFWTSTAKWYDPLTWGAGFWTTNQQLLDAANLREALSGVLDHASHHMDAPAAENKDK